MKNLKRLITGGGFIVLFGSVIYIVFYYFKNDLKISSVPPEIIEASRAVNIYQLDSNKYLNYPLLALSEKVRIVTNAEFSETMDLRESSNKEPYKVEVQAYDIDGNLVETRQLNYFTKTQFYFDENWGMYLPSFYLDSEALPSESRVSALNYTDTKKIAEIRLKRIDNNPHLKTIYARVYQPTGISDSQLDFYWYNLMPKDQIRLSSANLYPINLMSKEEKRNLIKNLWTLVGPEGVPKEDYQEKKLYSVIEPVGIPYDINLLHSGNYVDDTHQLVIPIEEDAINIQIEILTADIIYPKYMKIWLGEPDNKISTILKNMQKDNESIFNKSDNLLRFKRGMEFELEWRGRGLGQTIKNKEKIDRHFVKNYTFNSGLLTISSNAPAYVNVTKKVENKEEPIILEPPTVNMINLDQNKDLEFDVFNNPETLTSFRIDFRKISPKIFNQQIGEEVLYELVDNEGRIITNGVIKLKPVLTKLDFAVKRGNLFVSEKERYYFIFTKNVAKIRFKGQSDTFISVYNRLENFLRKYYIPEDYKPTNSDSETLRRTWFYKPPNNYKDLRLGQRTSLVKVQSRSIPENELVKAAIYNWKEILPEGNNWQAYEILEKRNLYIATRPEAEAVDFSKLPTNQKYNLKIIGYQGEKFVKPIMIIYSEIGTNIKIYVDDKEFFKFQTQTSNDAIQLPNIEIGEHEIYVKADKNSIILLNYNKNDNTNNLVRRNIIHLTKNPKNFLFEKIDDDEKVITLRAYSPDINLRKIAVTIEGQERVKTNIPLTSYTIKKRSYKISFNSNSKNPQFVSKETSNLFGAEPIFIKLGTDLPKGSYKINVSLEEGEEYYLSISSLMPGLVDNRTISTEVQDEE